jgi:hypothetical protein
MYQVSVNVTPKDLKNPEDSVVCEKKKIKS